jgi:hypothetical protein
VELQRDARGRFVGKTRTPPPIVADDLVIVFVELNRRTGKVTVDDAFATPAEAWAACYRAAEITGERFGVGE